MIRRALFIVVMMLAIGVTAWADQPLVGADDPRVLTFPPVPFQPPKPNRIVLPNGLIVYILEDHELPIVNLSAMIRTGSRYEPADKIGLASLTGTVMRTGGAGSLTGEQVDEEVEFVGAEMDSGIGLDAGSASLNVLKKDLARGVTLFADMLRHPTFAADKVDLAKKQAIESIRRRNDHPTAIAGREFGKLIYGADHPYARESTEATINAIARDDLVDFHSRYYHPNTTMIAVTGDVTRKEIVRLLTRAFAGWKPEKVEWSLVAPVKDLDGSSVNYIARDITQTQVRIGFLSVTQGDPDYFAFSLLDDILGGQAFTSRLFREVRTKAGLAYSVGSALIPGHFDRGSFLLYAQTKAQTTSQAVAAMLDEIRRIRTTPITAQELDDAKQAFLNSFVFSFATPSQIVGRQMSLEYYGLPADFLERFRSNVSRVTVVDLQRVAQRYLQPERMVVLAVGDQERFDKPLSTFGPVREIHLSQLAAVPSR